MKDKIATKRLTLRQLELSDVDALSRLGGEFDIARMTGSFPHPFPPLSAEFRLMYLKQKWRQGLAHSYAITLDGGELIGMVDLFRATSNDDFEIGYWLGKPFWGQGYATEAARAVLEEARLSLGVSLIKAGAFTDNPASLRVLEKLGFVMTGVAEPYFSMARMKNTPSQSFELDLDKFGLADLKTA